MLLKSLPLPPTNAQPKTTIFLLQRSLESENLQYLFFRYFCFFFFFLNPTVNGTLLIMESKFLDVEGFRYFRPFVREQAYSLRDKNVGLSVATVLALAFPPQCTNLTIDDDRLPEAKKFWVEEAKQGRVQLFRHKKSKDDARPFCGSFHPVEDANMSCERSDRIKFVRHVHEPPTRAVYIERLWMSPNGQITVINKPAGLGCTSAVVSCLLALVCWSLFFCLFFLLSSFNMITSHF